MQRWQRRSKGLEQQLHIFLSEHHDTVLVIIDTLQLIRGTNYDNTYANDYRDLSALKRIADTHGIAILLIHHLRKETADDVFNRISGTTAISGAVDSSFTLVEDRCGSGKAKLSCIGRDIEYRELTLERNAENVWEMISDSRTQPEMFRDHLDVYENGEQTESYVSIDFDWDRLAHILYNDCFAG